MPASRPEAARMMRLRLVMVCLLRFVVVSKSGAVESSCRAFRSADQSNRHGCSVSRGKPSESSQTPTGLCGNNVGPELQGERSSKPGRGKLRAGAPSERRARSAVAARMGLRKLHKSEEATAPLGIARFESRSSARSRARGASAAVPKERRWRSRWPVPARRPRDWCPRRRYRSTRPRPRPARPRPAPSRSRRSCCLPA